MPASIAQYLSAIPDLQTQRALHPLLTAVLADLAAINANNRTFLTGSDTWDAGSIADGDEAAKEITVTGAALGDFVVVSHGVDVADLACVGQVTAANTVTVTLLNNTGGNIDLASSTVRAFVIPQAAASIATNLAA
jgi:hypothetical protein